VPNTTFVVMSLRCWRNYLIYIKKINTFSIFQVIITFRITDLVMSKIFYKDRMQIQTCHKIDGRPEICYKLAQYWHQCSATAG